MRVRKVVYLSALVSLVAILGWGPGEGGRGSSDRLFSLVEYIRPGGACVSPNLDNGASALHGWSLPAGGLTYKVVTGSIPTGLDPAAAVSAINAAAAQWDVNTGAVLFTYGGPTNGDKQGVWDGQSSVKFGSVFGQAIAVALIRTNGSNVVQEADVILSKGYKWAANAGASGDCGGADGKFDVQDIATHELGHVVGAAHTSTDSANNAQTMYPFGSYKELFKQSIASGDKASLNSLYGP